MRRAHEGECSNRRLHHERKGIKKKKGKLEIEVSIRARSMMPAAKGCAPTLSTRLAAYKCKPPGQRRMAKRARGHQRRRVTCRAEDHKVYHT